MTQQQQPLDPPLDKSRHVRYWQRCFRSILPHHYTSNDSTRLTIGYFILAALDLLSSSSSFSSPPENPLALSLIPSIDRRAIRDWVISLQHPHGGFCGSPHHVLPPAHQSTYEQPDKSKEPVPTAADPENANIAATYFALLSLGVLAEDDGPPAFNRVDRLRTLRWLRSLQRDDGSFGENVDSNGYVAGGRDMRPCYLAATIRWMLGGAEAGPDVDFDVDKLVAHIRRSQAFDGGIAESSMHESHAGYAYCAVAALSLLDLANPDKSASPTHYLDAGIPSTPSLIYFLLSRQFAYVDPPPDADPTAPPPDLSALSLDDYDPHAALATGFNGRLNKVADTCYVWWVSGALTLLGQGALVDRPPARRFLLEKTQHLIGGFAKHPGDPPDVYHGYLGLAALATMAGQEQAAKEGDHENGNGNGNSNGREEGLGRFDPRLCVGAEASARIARARDALLGSSAAAPDSDPETDPDDWPVFPSTRTRRRRGDLAARWARGVDPALAHAPLSRATVSDA